MTKILSTRKPEPGGEGAPLPCFPQAALQQQVPADSTTTPPKHRHLVPFLTFLARYSALSPQPSRVLSCQPPWRFPKKTLCSSLDNLLTLQRHKFCLYRTNTSSQIAAASKMLCAYTENSLAFENKAGSPQDQPGTVHITVQCSHYTRLYNCHSRREMVSVSPVRDENEHEQGGILMNHIKPTF